MNKNKIVLVNPGIHFQKTLHYGMFPNTAIMILATILGNYGFQVKVIDGNYQPANDTVKLIFDEIDENLLYIGFSVMTIQLPWAYYVSQAIKSRYPQAFIIWGGTHASLFPEQTVEDSAVDMVVVNDAASTISALSLAIAQRGNLSGISGIFYKKNFQIIGTGPNENKDNFSNIPFIDLSLIDHKRYSTNNTIANEEFYGGRYKHCRAYPIITGLGCCYQCTFCINVILGRKYQYRSAGEIVERIKFLQKDYGADFIQPHDENFFISKKRIFQFLDLLEKEKLNIKWRPQLRADYFNDSYLNLEVARRLDNSGMVVAAMGVESASQEMLDKLKKDLKVEQIIKAAEILSKTDNIVTKMNFMVGLPGESQDDIEKTFKLAFKIKKIAKRSHISIYPFKPYPGSLLYDEIVSAYGYSPPNSLEDWAKVSRREFVDSVGYESFSNYKWINNPSRLEVKLYVHEQIAGCSPKLYKRIRRAMSSLRFRLNFFAFVLGEKRFFDKLKKIKETAVNLKYEIRRKISVKLAVPS